MKPEEIRAAYVEKLQVLLSLEMKARSKDWIRGKRSNLRHVSLFRDDFLP